MGFGTQHESVSLPLNVGLNLHLVWWSSPQSVHVSVFVERRPEKLGRYSGLSVLVMGRFP